MVTGWTPGGGEVIFLSARRAAFPKRDIAAYAVSISGGLARQLPMETAGLLSEAPDGHAIAYDRTFRTFGGDRWKRYVGGQAPDIFLYDLKSGQQTRVTSWAGTDTAPMWWQERLYFLSDRGPSHRLDLWVTDPTGRHFRQVTHVTNFDIDVPALGADSITFGLAGRIWCLDLPSERLHEVSIAVPPTERLQERRVNVAPQVRVTDIAGAPDQALASDGSAAVLAARGHLFVVRANGPTADLHAGPSTDDDHPAISPDDRTIAFVTDDAAGNRQVATEPLGGGPVRQLTRATGSVFGTPSWSLDGMTLAVPDEEHGLWLVAANGTVARRVAIDPIAAIRDPCFSPDGHRLAFSTTSSTGRHLLHVLDLGSGRDVIVTPPLESDHAPAFSADGRTLFFLSARHDRPILADRDQGPDISTTESDGLYSVALAAAPAMPAPNLTRDAVALPTAPGLLSDFAVRGDTVFYTPRTARMVEGSLPGPAPTLHALDLQSNRDRVIATDASNSIFAADGRTALFRRNVEWHLIRTTANTDTRLDLSALRVLIEPRAEWEKGIAEAWHLDRNLFWDPSLRGLDWSKIGARYTELARLAGSHEDEIYVLGEMQGELSSSHMFVAGGVDDSDDRASAPTALLGVDFAADAATGRYRLSHVYTGDPSRPRFRAPLGGPGITAHDGDVLLSIDGQSLRISDDPYRLLAGKHGPITLQLSASSGGSHHIVVVNPISSEVAIRQLDWIERNRARVNTLSHGRVGYIYLGNFGEVGTEDFVRQYYAQTDKDGLVIDERWNTGGFTSQWVISVLRRPPDGVFVNREGGVTTLPGSRPPPLMAVVTNIFSASDGDQFPYFMQREHLAVVVGERTWGGVAGIAGAWPLIDGTTVAIPKDRLLATNGQPIIENQGATPDILISNTPAGLAAHYDAQLERGVVDLLKERRQRATSTHAR
jgi:tricorn protease